MSQNRFEAGAGSGRPGNIVLIVDDVPENLAVLHDALDESGFTVLVANHGEAALERVRQVIPDIILLDAMMPGMDGFQVCRKLKENSATRHIPVVFMTGLTETEHVVAAFEAGGIDYVSKPVRTREVLARISTHLCTAHLMNQARSALDAFGHAVIAITPQDGRVVWQTPLAREWMQAYFPDHELGDDGGAPAALLGWVEQTRRAGVLGLKHPPLTVAQGARRLVLTAADLERPEQWMIVLSEESDTAQIEALMLRFKLTQRESEVLHWVIKGKTNRDIGEILGTSPRTVNKHLEHVYVKLGVETRTSAAALAMSRMRVPKQEPAPAAGPLASLAPAIAR